MAADGEHGRLVGVLEHGVALALGMSAVFLLLVAVSTPVIAAAVILPASVALGVARARLMPHPAPHCEVAPTFVPAVVVNAPRASSLGQPEGGATSAA